MWRRLKLREARPAKHKQPTPGWVSLCRFLRVEPDRVEVTPMILTESPAHRPFAALRELVRPRPPAGGAASFAVSDRSIPTTCIWSRRPRAGLVCACDPCAFSARDGTRYKRVSRDIQSLHGFRLSDSQWESLHIPIDLASLLLQPGWQGTRIVSESRRGSRIAPQP